MSTSTPRVIIVMGVSSGETIAFGSALAAALGWRLEETGSPLEQAERWRQVVGNALRDEAGLVLVCPPTDDPLPALDLEQPGVALVQLGSSGAAPLENLEKSTAAFALDLASPVPQLVRTVRERLVI